MQTKMQCSLKLGFKMNVFYCFYKIILKIHGNIKRHNRVYILSSKHTYRPMRACVVAQLFYNIVQMKQFPDYMNVITLTYICLTVIHLKTYQNKDILLTLIEEGLAGHNISHVITFHLEFFLGSHAATI